MIPRKPFITHIIRYHNPKFSTMYLRVLFILRRFHHSHGDSLVSTSRGALRPSPLDCPLTPSDGQKRKQTRLRFLRGDSSSPLNPFPSSHRRGVGHAAHLIQVSVIHSNQTRGHESWSQLLCHFTRQCTANEAETTQRHSLSNSLWPPYTISARGCILCNSKRQHEHPTCAVSRLATFVIEDNEDLTSRIDKCLGRNDWRVRKSLTSDFLKLVGGWEWRETTWCWDIICMIDVQMGWVGKEVVPPWIRS